MVWRLLRSGRPSVCRSFGLLWKTIHRYPPEVKIIFWMLEQASLGYLAIDLQGVVLAYRDRDKEIFQRLIQSSGGEMKISSGGKKQFSRGFWWFFREFQNLWRFCVRHFPMVLVLLRLSLLVFTPSSCGRKLCKTKYSSYVELSSVVLKYRLSQIEVFRHLPNVWVNVRKQGLYSNSVTGTAQERGASPLGYRATILVFIVISLHIYLTIQRTSSQRHWIFAGAYGIFRGTRHGIPIYFSYCWTSLLTDLSPSHLNLWICLARLLHIGRSTLLGRAY